MGGGGASTAIICENVHRVKGLEFDYVLLAAANNDMTDALHCVGASRGVSGLTVVGPHDLGIRLGLADPATV
ncbi:MAG: hypothetical protein JWN99_1001 [Ilumatobacteraceae bacterium]|nr:hypothetical protein [Ilumatobacteraceae bacterium]